MFYAIFSIPPGTGAALIHRTDVLTAFHTKPEHFLSDGDGSNLLLLRRLQPNEEVD